MPFQPGEILVQGPALQCLGNLGHVELSGPAADGLPQFVTQGLIHGGGPEGLGPQKELLGRIESTLIHDRSPSCFAAQTETAAGPQGLLLAQQRP